MHIKTVQVYQKIMNRPLSLIDCECWDIGERIKLPKKFKNLLFFDPLFIYTPKKAVAVYYNFTDPKQNPQPLITYLQKKLSWLKKEKVKFDKNCQEIRMLIKNNSADYKKIAELNHNIWAIIAIANVLGRTEAYKVSKKLKLICIQIRNESDDILHPSLTYLNKIIAKHFKIKNTQNILLSEVLKHNIPNKEEIIKREDGWIYHKGNIIFDSKKYFKDKNIQIVNPSKKNDTVITGSVACKGFAKGKAKIVFELSELNKIENGNILITPMTTPEMMPALKKASAIVTDEGGITCHAAIVSRELKKPCIIGTKIATKILRDGQIVKVDADKGIVRIIKP
ncbi:PEP-utilizing enzyme [Patescibacteria group bacterium]